MPFDTIVGVGGFLLLMVLICLGIPIFVAMFIISMAGFWLLSGPDLMITNMTTGPYTTAQSYMFAVIPLFMLMGELAAQTGLAEDAFNALNKWVGRLRGGLLMATIGANAVFGAVSATPIAVTTMSMKVALPQLLKFKYDRQFSLAAIATAGVLDALIPPSSSIVMFCILTNVSIGRALVAGIIPGITLTLLYFLTIWIYGKFAPDKIPVVEVQTNWRERFSSLGNLWPIVLIFMVIIGGIYLGIFPPTVGGAVGATTTMIYALARRVKISTIINSFKDMCIINCQIFIMVIAGFMFSRFMAISGIADYLINFVQLIDAPPLLIMTIIVMLYILISFPMDLMPVMIITLPIFFPLLTGIGFDPFVIVVVLVLLGTLGNLTPPIGMSIYIVAGMANVGIMEVYRGVTPWFIMTFLFTWIIILWPPLTTWLPNLLYK